jgi:3-oxoacyl-ACP reductase-like protein
MGFLDRASPTPVSSSSGASQTSAGAQVCIHCGKNPNGPSPAAAATAAAPSDPKALVTKLLTCALTHWETDFLSDQLKNLEKYKTLTPKQMAVVNKIWAEKGSKTNVPTIDDSPNDEDIPF